MKATLLAWLLLLACLFSCQRDSEETPDRRALITARAWRLDQALVNGLPVTDPQVLNAIGSFNQSRLRFNNDGTFTSTNTATNSVSTGTWEFSNGQEGLTINIDNQTYQFTIKALTANQMNLTTPYTITTPFQATLEAELRLIPA
jgi:hypothetical protein